MKRTLSFGQRRFEIDRASGEAAPRFDERTTAAGLLARLCALPENRSTIRRFVAELSPGLAPRLLTDAALIAEARRLLTGGWALLRETVIPSAQGGGGPDEEDEPAPTSAREARAELTWIEIRLIGEDDLPIPSERYRIELPDGSSREGSLDDKGIARVSGIDPGSCVVTFPALDEEAWVRA